MLPIKTVFFRYADSIKGIRKNMLSHIQDSAFLAHDHVTKHHQSLCDVLDHVTSQENDDIDKK